MRDRPPSHDLWAITSYFNPMGYRTRLANYRSFQRNLTLPLLTVEMGFEGRFDLAKEDATILVQVPSSALMWQKERLLNVALGSLPGECRNLAWLDCDLVFERDDWPARATEALTNAVMVQLFSWICSLPRAADLAQPLAGQAYVRRPSLAWGWAEGRADRNHLAPSVTSGLVGGFSSDFANGHAWAIRRDALDPIGFYDAMIVGSGDYSMVQAALGRFETVRESRRLNPRRYRHYVDWARKFHQIVQGRIGIVPGEVYHLWHGELADRQYRARHGILADHDFDPYQDIALDEHGCWRWSSDKPALHDAVRAYFEGRREDGRA